MAGSNSRRPRPGIVAAGLLALGMMSAIALPASALAGGLATLSATCTTGAVTTQVTLSFHPANSFDPLFNLDAGTVFIPLQITADGTVVVDRLSGISGSAVTTSTCAFTTPNADYVVIGFFAPGT